MMEYDEFRAMNTTILVAAEGERKALMPGFILVRQWIEEAEARFSRFRQSSELSALNRSAGRWFDLSDDMYTLLMEAQAAYQMTGGLFDPTILPALAYAGYDRSMDEIRVYGAAPEPEGLLPFTPGFDLAQFDPERRAIWIPSDMQIDLGGIAKGWIAAKAVEKLTEFTDAGAVSAGGDMVLFGLPEGEPAWQVSLEDPRDDSQTLAVLAVGPGAVATSSVSKRRWTQQEQMRHHIIDPRVDAPSETPWLCVTVYTAQATHAEAFAKALLIAGPDEAWGLAAEQDGLQFLAVQADGGMVGNFENMEVANVAATIF
ncbi:MAG: FAD:protein FMN transferase [Anaerolineales bacterium]